MLNSRISIIVSKVACGGLNSVPATLGPINIYCLLWKDEGDIREGHYECPQVKAYYGDHDPFILSRELQRLVSLTSN